jgi:hypothetical protein
MTPEDLERLCSPDFEAQVVASTPRILRLRLRRCHEIRGLREQYDEGTLPDALLRQFVNGLLRRNRDPDWFPHQTALAAIAVVLEERFSPFSEMYLIDLARVKTGRLATASRVARLCLDARRMAPRNEMRVFAPEAEIEADFNGSVADGCGRYSWDQSVPDELSVQGQVC